MKKKRMMAVFLAVMLFVSALAPTALAQETPEIHVIENHGYPQTVRAFVSSLNLAESCTAAVLKDTQELAPDAHVGTGQRLEVRDAEGTVIETKSLVVMGDVTGIGYAALQQLIRMSSALAGTEPLEGLFARAADLNGSGAFDLSDLVLEAQEYAEVSGALSSGAVITGKAVPLYEFSASNPDEITLHFMDGAEEIPYISTDGIAELLIRYWGDYREDPGAKITYSTEPGLAVYERENGSQAVIDFRSKDVFFSDFDQFISPSYSLTCIDILMDTGFDAEGNPAYYAREEQGSFERPGLPIDLSLAAYEIPMVYKDGMGYIPLQTATDLFMAANLAMIIYNGESCVIFTGSNLPEELAEIVYSVPPRVRSQELATYSYNELCLAMDMLYGLKEQHDIESFDTLFRQTGLYEKLTSTDPIAADEAIYELVYGYLGDLHSTLLETSPYAGKDIPVDSPNVSASVLESERESERLAEVRAEAYPEGIPGYEEVGDTAYVTFDDFTPPSADYYSEPPTADAEDTIGLIMYAHSQIMREDSPIENVVIDLTNNTGGSTDAAVYVACWFLGMQASFNLNNTLTEAQATSRYWIDTNGDREFDMSDTVFSKNRYCLISPNSFSCGNLVPAVFKASGQVTLLGKNTGGGACVVQPLTLADGTSFLISGATRFSSVSNGSYYDVDKGIEPDVPIVNLKNFYDREAMTEYIGGLFR